MSNSRSWQLLTIAIGFLITSSNVLAINDSPDTDRHDKPPTPIITRDFREFLEGETFSLNCSVTYQPNSPVSLFWNFSQPTEKGRIIHDTNENKTTGGILYHNITIVNATEKDAGKYTCISKSISNHHREANTEKIYKGDTGYINVSLLTSKRIKTRQKVVNLFYTVDCYPPASYEFFKNGKELLINPNTTKYKVTAESGEISLKINTLDVYDTANYTLVLRNKYVTKNETYDLRVEAPPKVDFGAKGDKTFLLNTRATLKCSAIGYPLPQIKWIFDDGTRRKEVEPKNVAESLIQVSSYLDINVTRSGNITCLAENKSNNTMDTRNFFVYEVPNGFGLKNENRLWFSEGQQVSVDCYASLYYFNDIKWFRNNTELNATFSQTQFSIVAQLKISKISLEDEGEYECFGEEIDNTSVSQKVYFTVAARKPPVITIPTSDIEEQLNPYQKKSLICQAVAVPPPNITWFKDGKVLFDDGNIFYDNTDHTMVNSSIEITLIDDEKSLYECAVESGGETVRRSFNLVRIDKHKSEVYYLYIIGVIIFFFAVLIFYLLWKMRKVKQSKKELLAAGLWYFNEGLPKSINPELGIDEQAELLPYDERFEFPSEKLQFGKQLGAGAFGVVYKAEARGIINAEETTTVAVKTVKKTADNMYIKALASELKIMCHLGKHVNIVNLLGACTKHVAKRELVVIVEYCKFGNIHNYMQRHREVFIDQFTDNKEKNLGKVNRGFESTNGSTGMHSDYFGTNHTQETVHTFVNTANTNRSMRKDNANQQVEFVRVSETGYIQPEWRSNYETDYIDGRNPRPLTSRDLLAWAFQIARGMEYLANKKVLHGDLAARNVLLAEDNIVKICDFGLARSIYKNDEYQKQENSPLPVKWLAIECMTDRIFSTQSDVWSFGIVLWELFTLAKTPYPNVSPTSLVQWLTDGHRLAKPQYADDRLYDVMLRCWQQKPTARPNFSQLQEILGSFLEDNVRNHYVDLNSPYMDLNVRKEGEEDYLAMVCAPDYNNMVTPSPHHYVNDSKSFFPPTPTQLKHDEEGYLQMSPASQSIYSPRVQSTKFDFDARKFNSGCDPSQGSELTPMLTLNNLPRSGSESDHEGNNSPYLNMCHRIDENDEVFENQYNLKNVQINDNTAVSNPTYITYDGDLKKPHNISNNYTNINVPNGLVK
ncbi:unnamed protein product, partial [Brenthis ino]